MSLLILPAVLALRDDPSRFAIALAAAVILGMAIAYSKRTAPAVALPRETLASPVP